MRDVVLRCPLDVDVLELNLSIVYTRSRLVELNKKATTPASDSAF